MNASKLTKQIIAKMLKENTGRSILDSGDHYGRHYERNQSREFENEKEVSLTLQFKYIDYTKNIYHFLCNALDYNKGLTNSFYHFESKHSDKFKYDSSWDNTIAEWLKYKKYHVICSDYTYNQENMLSQDFIYTLVSKEETRHSDLYDAEFCILQIHNGCDARGGFTSPKIFGVDVDMIFDYNSGYITCDNPTNRHVWYTDDSYHWYSDNNHSDKRLEKYQYMNYEDWIETDEYKDQTAKMIVIPDNQLPMFNDYNPKIINPVNTPADTILIDNDNNGLCPICGYKLMA